MLKFLKKIFIEEDQEEPKPKESIQVNLNELDAWIEEREKPLIDETLKDAGQILQKLDEELQRTQFNLEVLENSKLQNPNIPYKAKQYMEGNRETYIRSINSFIGRLEINNKAYSYLKKFCEDFDELIENLNKSTHKSYAILLDFFANETKKIAQNIKNIDSIFAELKKIINSEKLTRINESKEKLRNLKAAKKQKINLDLDFKNISSELGLESNEKEKIMKEIEEFNNSTTHKEYEKLKAEKKEKVKELEVIKENFLQSFSTLEKALRKFSHVSFEHEKLILDYIDKPIDTLLEDQELKLLEALDKLNDMLKNNELKIDEKKIKKSIEEIKKLDKPYLETFRKNYYDSLELVKEIEEKITRSGVAEKLKELNKKLQDANNKIETDSKEHEKLKSEVEKQNKTLQESKKEVEEALGKSFNLDVSVKV